MEEKTEKQIPLPYHSYIIFIMGILVYTFTYLLIKGYLFNLYSSNDFDDKEYLSFWKNMTSEQRLFNTETYYRFYLILKQRILNIQQENKNKKIKIESKYLHSNFTRFHFQFENIPYILVSLIPKEKTNFKKKLLICSHFDGHNLTEGGTAYDDAIHTVTMIGVIDALSKKNIELNTQIDFLFDGAEEFGLVGAYQYVEYLKENNLSENYDHLNLESMGGSTPYAFVIKNSQGNFRIQKALSKSRGSILLSFNYLFAGLIKSTTDHAVFDEQNWTGGVNVFLGKSSVYHTKYDKIIKEDDIRIAGCQLLDFALNYQTEGYNGNSIGYGIAPMCVVLPILFFYIVNPIIFVISMVLIIIKERKNVKEFLFDLLFEFICFIVILVIYIIIGLLVYLINSNSASNGQAFIILSAFMGLFLFLIFQRIFKIKKWSRFRLILDLLLMMVAISTDLSLPFLALSITSTIFYFFENKIVKYISAFFQYLIMSLFFAFFLQFVLQFSPRLNPIIGNLVVFVFFFIFSYHISASPLDLYDITKEDKIIKLIKNFFKKNSEDLNESINNDEQYDIMDELIEEENNNNSKTNNSKNKHCNKKYLPVYLLFFYLLYILVILLTLFLKPFPYSKSYTIIGAFLNVYTDAQNSTMIFMPYNSYNYPKKYIKESGLSFTEGEMKDYLDGTEHEGKIFAVKSKEAININNPKCVFDMPEISKIMKITYNITTNNKYKFYFNINISNIACIEGVYLYIKCKDCVEEINGIANDKSNYYKNNVLLIRPGKEKITNDSLPDFITETNMILNVKEFKYILLLNTKKNSKDYLKFLESFGEASVNIGQFAPCDTLYKYEEEYKSGN